MFRTPLEALLHTANVVDNCIKDLDAASDVIERFQPISEVAKRVDERTYELKCLRSELLGQLVLADADANRPNRVAPALPLLPPTSFSDLPDTGDIPF